MGFLKRLFGGGGKSNAPVDKNGVYMYFRSPKAADAVTKVRADKQHDLNRTDNGFVWHKTIVDSKYFSRIQAIVYFDGNYQVSNSDLTGGEMITAEEYEAALAERERAKQAALEAEENEAAE